MLGALDIFLDGPWKDTREEAVKYGTERWGWSSFFTVQWLEGQIEVPCPSPAGAPRALAGWSCLWCSRRSAVSFVVLSFVCDQCPDYCRQRVPGLVGG